MDEALLSERAEAAADFYSAVSYVVLAAPARALAHPLLASLLPALAAAR